MVLVEIRTLICHKQKLKAILIDKLVHLIGIIMSSFDFKAKSTSILPIFIFKHQIHTQSPKSLPQASLQTTYCYPFLSFLPSFSSYINLIIIQMNKNKSSKEEGLPPTAYKFYLGSRERYIHIDCSFESANIQLVRQMSEFHYRLSCIDDGLKTGSHVNSKSWFYFTVHGFPKNTKGRFAVSRVQTLMAVYSQFPKSYRPVYRECMLGEQSKWSEWSKWSRIPTECPLMLRESGELQVTFEFLFKTEGHKVEFAFAYPYTYSDNLAYLTALNEFYCSEEFYFYKEILVHSPQERDIHLLTITSHDQLNLQSEDQQLFNEKLFPQRRRPKRFKKPVVLITARVHPGETAASYTMQGIINFLTDSRDARSFLLKKMFVFMLVPMINVDGVYHGHFRMDTYGKNLNRYYVDPDIKRQPAVYAIKELAAHLIKDNRLAFYFDLHAHNANKGAFIYGNAINDFVEQVESQVFCKLFAMNHSGFQYDYCNFSPKQMTSKDRNEDRTKEGCGRVVMHRMANIIHSYSLECGIICPTKYTPPPPVLNPNFTVQAKGLVETPSGPQETFFTEESYRELGKSLLVSILDVFDKNPFSRVYNSSFKSLQMLRRVTAFEVFHTAERFRMFQKYVYGKVRNINQLIRQVLNSKLHYRELYNFYFLNDNALKGVEWPDNIPGLARPKVHPKLKRFRSMQEPKTEYSLSFFNDLKASKYELDRNDSLTPPSNPEEGDADSYSSQTDDERQLKEVDKEYISQMMTSSCRETLNQVFMEKSDSISSRKASEVQEISPERRVRSSERENDSEEVELEIEKAEEGISDHFKDILEVRQINKLKLIENRQELDVKEIKMHNESPSVRVRRLLKQDNGSRRVKLTNEQMKDKLTEIICQPPSLAHNRAFLANASTITNEAVSNYIHMHGEQSPSQDRQLRLLQIKHEIKEELRRHKDKKAIACSAVKGTAHSKLIKSNLFQRNSKEKERIKSTNLNCLNLNTQISLLHHKHKSETLNRIPSKTSIDKTQLPSLNSQILIITNNSSKGLTHNQ